MANLRQGMLFGMGSPLLDMTTEVDSAFLDKYGLKPNDTVRAEHQNLPLFKELQKFPNVRFTAGGTVQNTFRVVQWILQKPGVVTLVGSIGNDQFGKELERQAISDGVNVGYEVIETVATGVCAVLLTDNCRTLCTNLGASSHFEKRHFDKPENLEHLRQASYFYTSALFLAVSPESLMAMAEYAASSNKTFALNLGAPFILERFAGQFDKMLQYVDVLFGNEAEAKALSQISRFCTDDIREIAVKAQTLQKITGRSRIVVFTQEENPVIVAERDKVTAVPVTHLNEVKDTNGAGDAFVGGFIAQYIQGRSVESCVQCGIWAASEVIQNDGCNFSKHKTWMKEPDPMKV